MWMDELRGFEYYLMLFYEGEFLHLIIFFQKRQKEEKEKRRNCLLYTSDAADDVSWV